MALPGASGGGGFAVLEDPTGKRARWMGRAGRVVFALFLGWLMVIVLGGLGLMPVAGLPFTRVLQPSQGPPPVLEAPKTARPRASDLRPAVPAKLFAASTAAAARPLPKHLSHGTSAVVHHGTKSSRSSHPTSTTAHAIPGPTPAAVLTTHGRSSVAPGQTKSIAPPGQTKAPTVAHVSHGQSANAAGRTKTVTAARVSSGKSLAAPGQTTSTAATSASHGKSAAAPPKAATTTTTTSATTTTTTPVDAPGQSAFAPGQVKKSDAPGQLGQEP